MHRVGPRDREDSSSFLPGKLWGSPNPHPYALCSAWGWDRRPDDPRGCSSQEMVGNSPHMRAQALALEGNSADVLGPRYHGGEGSQSHNYTWVLPHPSRPLSGPAPPQSVGPDSLERAPLKNRVTEHFLPTPEPCTRAPKRPQEHKSNQGNSPAGCRVQ